MLLSVEVSQGNLYQQGITRAVLSRELEKYPIIWNKEKLEECFRKCSTGKLTQQLTLAPGVIKLNGNPLVERKIKTRNQEKDWLFGK